MRFNILSIIVLVFSLCAFPDDGKAVWVSCTEFSLYKIITDENGEVTPEIVGSQPDISTFIINENETMITHRTNDMQSSYYVQSSSFDEEKSQFTAGVVSDVGNDYFFTFNFETSLVSVFGKGNDGKMFMTVYTVKAFFMK